MKSLRWLSMFALGLGLLAYSCDYPEFEFRSKSSPTTTSTPLGGTGGTGASGTGGGGATTTSSTTTTSSSTGGAGPECTAVGSQDSCGAGYKCSVITPNTGALGCVAAGTTADFAICSNNTQCGVSSWCDSTTGVCKPVCADADDCPGAASNLCAQALEGGQGVPDLKICTAHCHPTLLNPCGPGVNCVHPGTPNDFDCYASGNGGYLDQCSHGRDCEPGLLCSPNGRCTGWCPDPAYCCGECVFWVCTPCQNLSPPITYDGTPMAACYGTSGC